MNVQNPTSRCKLTIDVHVLNQYFNSIEIDNIVCESFVQVSLSPIDIVHELQIKKKKIKDRLLY